MAYITKVIFENSDGTSKYIDGQDLERWLSFNAIVASEAERHGINPPWKEIRWRIIDGKTILEY